MRRSLFTMLTLFLLGGSSLLAQNNGTFNGRVVDPAGAVVIGATVSATNTGTGISRSTVTNSDGLYTIPALNPGAYDVKVENAGFATSETKGVNLLSGTTLTLDFTISVASLSQQVQVTAEAPIIETTTSEVSSALQTTEVQQLPMLNRSLASLLTLLPGARETTSSGTGFSVAHSYVAIAGSIQGSVMLVDGVENHEDNDGGTMMAYTLEGVQEFKLLTHDYAPEYGRAGTAVILMTTKSGTNQVHGSVFGYGRSDALTKVDYFSDPSHGGLGKAPYSREQYGGSIGGPIIKDKAFYAGSVERISQAFSLPVAPTVYTQEAALAQALPNIGVIPTQSISQPYRDLMINVKTNYQLSQNHSLFVRYSRQSDYVTNGGVASNRTLLTASPSQSDKNNFHTETAALGETWVINPTTVNQFTAQFIDFTHRDIYSDCSSVGFNTCILQRLTFPSFSTGVVNAFTFLNVEKKWQFKDDFSKQLGKHALKFGADFSYIPALGGSSGNSGAGAAPGGITFFSDPTTILSNAVLYPQGLQTPGIVNKIVEVTQNTGNFSSYDAKQFGAYVQDNFKLTPRFTLNLGLRYDIYWFMNQNNGLLEQNRVYQTLKAIGSPYGKLPHTSTLDLSPRIGLAWDIGGNGKNVLRAGYGIFYNSGLINSYFNQNQFEQPNLFFGETITDTAAAIGARVNDPTVGTLYNFVYGVSPLPPGPGANPTQLPVGQNVTGNWYDPNLTDGRTQQSNIGYSHAFSERTVLSADYTHVLSLHEWDFQDINPICTANFMGPCGISGYPNVLPGTRILANALQAVYQDAKRLANVSVVSSVNRSTYDELAVHFERRTERVTFQVNYVLSRSFGYGGNVGGFTGYSSGTFPEIPSAYGGCVFCAGEWGPGATDERHRFTFAGVFRLPFGVEVSPTFTVASARPYQLFRAPNSDGDGSFRCFVNNCIGGSGDEVAVNAARGLPLLYLNSRVTRRFKISESKAIDGFVEFFNITDRANFGSNYGTNAVSTTTFQKPTAYIGGAGSSSTVPNSFQVQLGARFSF